MPTAVIWSSIADGDEPAVPGLTQPPTQHRMVSFMFEPAIHTVRDGLAASNFSTVIGHGPLALIRSKILDTLSAGDVFVWVGVANMEWAARPNGLPAVTETFHKLTKRGVLTVLYATETNEHHPCDEKRRLPVREVWEYTRTNLICCPDDPAGVRVRYVPPGYSERAARRPLASSHPSSSSVRKLIFLGSAASFYRQRRACLQHITRGLVDGQRAHMPALPVHCAGNPCARKCDKELCPLKIVHSADSDVNWDGTVASHSSFLNLHKACEWGVDFRDPIHASNASCESFRLADLLASGGSVFSEHCHPADEEEYAGLVHFLPTSSLSAAVLDTWHRGKSTLADARQRRASFALRFAPAAIFERAGLMEALAAHKQHPHSKWSRRASLLPPIPGTRPPHEMTPAFCCFNRDECELQGFYERDIPKIRVNSTAKHYAMLLEKQRRRNTFNMQVFKRAQVGREEGR